jgi:uncharacterized membrane protein
VSKFLNTIGITADGIEGPALYVVMAGLACFVIFNFLRTRAAKPPKRATIGLYAGAAAFALLVMWISDQIDSLPLRYVLGAVMLIIAALAYVLADKKYPAVKTPADAKGGAPANQ